MTDARQEAKRNNIKLLKEANKILVLQCIMKLAPISTEEILKHTGLSRPTVINLLKELTDEEIVTKAGFSESSGGRSAALLALNGEKHFALGIDFEFPVVRMAIANMKGDIRAQESVVYPQGIGKEDLLPDLLRRIDRFIGESGIDPALLDGAGVGISGVIDSINGISMNIERIHGWHNVALKSELEKQLKMPVLIRNDVHLLGLVEKRLYLGDEVSDFIYVGIRSGIGSITYQHNKAMRGDKGNAGFIGHTSLDPHGPRCCCGSRGCLEAYAGQLAIMEHYAEQSGQHPDFEEIICRGKAGEPLAQSVLSEAGFYFGVALSNLIKTFEIPDVVIGGSPALADSPFMEAARSALRDYNTESLGIHLRLRMGQLPERQYALGGCYLVFDHMFSRPKLALTVV